MFDYGLVGWGYFPDVYEDLFLCHYIQTGFVTQPASNSLRLWELPVFFVGVKELGLETPNPRCLKYILHYFSSPWCEGVMLNMSETVSVYQ